MDYAGSMVGGQGIGGPSGQLDIASSIEANIDMVDLPAYERHQNNNILTKDLCYEVEEQGLEWWQRIASFQMPWEWKGGNKPKRQILNNVSFQVESGQMLAVLGSSGSGKTTLLDVIYGQATGGEASGQVNINGAQRTTEVMKEQSAYVRQNDRLLPHLTVKETLMFVAQLKLPTSWSIIKIEDRVESVIAELGLRHVSNMKVGGIEIRGISGGERRRVSIAVQLLIDPNILFLDEPTSGLDSFTAHHLVETLAKLSNNNRIVMMTIHQPRSDIFELFDLIMLLSQGNVVYFGKASQMVDYFTELGYPCPELTNPCDYYVDLTTVDMKTIESEGTTAERVNQLVEIYRSKDSGTATANHMSDDRNEQQHSNHRSSDLAARDPTTVTFAPDTMPQVHTMSGQTSGDVSGQTTGQTSGHTSSQTSGDASGQMSGQTSLESMAGTSSQCEGSTVEVLNQQAYVAEQTEMTYFGGSSPSPSPSTTRAGYLNIGFVDDDETEMTEFNVSPGDINIDGLDSTTSQAPDVSAEVQSPSSSSSSAVSSPYESSSITDVHVTSTSEPSSSSSSAAPFYELSPNDAVSSNASSSCNSDTSFSIPASPSVAVTTFTTSSSRSSSAASTLRHPPPPPHSSSHAPPSYEQSNSESTWNGAGRRGSGAAEVIEIMTVSGSLDRSRTVPPAPASLQASPMRQASIAFPDEEKAGSGQQFWVLFRRALTNNLEDYSFLGVQAIEALSMSLMIGLVFYNLGVDQISIRDRFGLLYIIGALYPYMVILDVVGQYHRERNILYFEMQDNLYTTTPYFLAKVLSEIPEHTCFIFLYSSCVYFMAGLQDEAANFFLTLAIVFLVVYCSRAMGMAAAAALPTYQMSVVAAQALFTCFLLSCGFIFNLENIWIGVQWMSYISYLKWSYQAMCQIEFNQLNFTCTLPMEQACIYTGDQALKVYSLDGAVVWQCALIVCAEITVFLFLFYLAMRFISQKPHEH